MPKSKKGTVSIGEDRGWLRLRFRHEGERYTLALSLIDNDVNRAIAAERLGKLN